MGNVEVVENKRAFTMAFRMSPTRRVADAPHPPLFLKRYDYKRDQGWGSANDMIPRQLDGQIDRAGEGRKRNRKRGLANTGKDSTP